MKRVIYILLVFCLLLSLTACGRRDNGLFVYDSADARPTAVQLFVCGENGKLNACTLGSVSDTRKLVEQLSKVRATEVPDWSLETIGYPIYGMCFTSRNGQEYDAVWTNGCWIDGEGQAWRFDYDFETMRSDYAFEPDKSGVTMAELPCVRYLAEGNEGWNSAFMTPAHELDAPVGITMTVDSYTPAELTATILNDTDEYWEYGEAFSLQVLLENQWYHVPRYRHRVAVNAIAYLVEPNSSRTGIKPLSLYGELPAGTYRLVVEGLCAEFTVE